jgi:hypothetical protein
MTTCITPKRLLAIWGALITATSISVALAAHHTIHATGARLGTAIALAVAFAKAQLIGAEFMELRTAPRALSITFSAWLLTVGATVIGLYLAA